MELKTSAGGGMLAPFQSFLFNDGCLSAKGCVAALTRVRIQSCTFQNRPRNVCVRVAS